MTEKIMRKKTIKCLEGKANVNKNQLRTPMQFPVQFLMICLLVKVNMKLLPVDSHLFLKNIEENIYTCYFFEIIGLGISSVLIVGYFLISSDIMHKNPHMHNNGDDKQKYIQYQITDHEELKKFLSKKFSEYFTKYPISYFFFAFTFYNKITVLFLHLFIQTVGTIYYIPFCIV